MFADLPLGIAIETLAGAGVAGGGASGVGARGTSGDAVRLQGLLEHAKSAGFHVVQLDGTKAGLRARELDRSARRDVASMLRRAEVGFAGLDMWVPSEHFARAETVDRAVSAVVDAAELAADLAKLAGLLGGTKQAGRPSVCVALPREVDRGIAAAIGAAGDRFGVAVVDFGEAAIERLRHAPARVQDTGVPNEKDRIVRVQPEGEGNGGGVGRGAQDEAIGLGVDPAALMLAGVDVAAVVSRAGRRIAAARLTDVAKTPDKRRVGAGNGSLDLLSYRVALTTAGFSGAVIVDVGGVANAPKAARVIAERWNESMLM